MDIIYADAQMRDIGVIQGCDYDLAYGLDENNFELTVALHEPECGEDYYIYIENTEYGGIVDKISADTKANELIYSGRSWHGILASKVIEPDAGQGYYIVEGEANAILRDIISRVGLDDLFEVSNEVSEIDVDVYQFRYQDVNTGIFDMLYKNDGKLHMSCYKGKVHIEAVRLMNYASMEEFSGDIVEFTIGQSYNFVNHLVCLGQGELENRAVIHLFTDAHGGIQPYLKSGVTEPIEDSDYILDKSAQVMKGVDEYAEVYDYPDAEIITNYKPLTEKPDDWDENYFSYFERNEGDNDSYDNIERNLQDVYHLLTAKPSLWNSDYDKYYTRKWDSDANEYVYESVQGDATYTYTAVTSKPKDWNKTYSKYYKKSGNDYKKIGKVAKYTKLKKRPKDWAKNYGNYYSSDGVKYSKISSASKNRYKLQTVLPSDWSDNWKNYYIKKKVSRVKTKYVKLGESDYYKERKTAPKWEKKKFYTQQSYSVTPKYNSFDAVYKQTMVLPTFSAQTVYTRTTKMSKTWADNTYYEIEKDVDLGAEFEDGNYYEEVEDRLATLVEGGIEKLEEYANADTLEINLQENDNVYDVGDIVGATEETTGLSTAQPIVKKIIKITNDVITIQHEVK